MVKKSVVEDGSTVHFIEDCAKKETTRTKNTTIRRDRRSNEVRNFE